MAPIERPLVVVEPAAAAAAMLGILLPSPTARSLEVDLASRCRTPYR